jgi:hypothetical protein
MDVNDTLPSLFFNNFSPKLPRYGSEVNEPLMFSQKNTASWGGLNHQWPPKTRRSIWFVQSLPISLCNWNTYSPDLIRPSFLMKQSYFGKAGNVFN